MKGVKRIRLFYGRKEWMMMKQQEKERRQIDFRCYSVKEILQDFFRKLLGCDTYKIRSVVLPDLPYHICIHDQCLGNYDDVLSQNVRTICRHVHTNSQRRIWNSAARFFRGWKPPTVKKAERESCGIMRI